MANVQPGYYRSRDIGSGVSRELDEIATYLNWQKVASDIIPSRNNLWCLGETLMRWRCANLGALDVGLAGLTNGTSFFRIDPIFTTTTLTTITANLYGSWPSLNLRGPLSFKAVGTAPTSANSNIFLNPFLGSSTSGPYLTVRRESTVSSADPYSFVIDFPQDNGGGTLRTFRVTSSDSAFFADITADHVINAGTAFHAGPLGGNRFRFTYTAPNGPGTISTDAGDITLDPFTTLLNIDADALPNVANTFDIGASGTKWQDGHFNGTVSAGTLSATTLTVTTINATNVDVSGTLTVNTITSRASGNNLTISAVGSGVVIVNDELNVGSTAANRVLINSDASVGIITTVAGGGNLRISATGGTVVFRNSLRVEDSVPTTMGTWSAVNGALTSGTHSALADNTYDLGASGTEWRTLYIQTSIIAPDNFTIDLSKNAATTLSLLNSNGSNVCHVAIDGGLSVGVSVTNATGTAHATELRGGAAAGPYARIYDSGFGAPVVTSSNSALFLATNGTSGAGTVSVPLDAFSGGSSISAATSLSAGTTCTAGGNINSTGGAIQTNSTTRISNAGALSNITTIAASGNIDTSGGALQTNGTTRITNGGVTNNLEMNGGATGCKLLLKDGSPSNNMEITFDTATSTLIVKDSTGTDHNITF